MVWEATAFNRTGMRRHLRRRSEGSRRSDALSVDAGPDAAAVIIITYDLSDAKFEKALLEDLRRLHADEVTKSSYVAVTNRAPDQIVADIAAITGARSSSTSLQSASHTSGTAQRPQTQSWTASSARTGKAAIVSIDLRHHLAIDHGPTLRVSGVGSRR